MRIKHLNHSTYKLRYHIVWGTKYRRKWLKDYVVHDLRKIFFETVRKYPTLFIIKLATDEDHVHIQMEIAPNIAISDAVRVLKSDASRKIRKKYKFIDRMHIEKDGIWSVGYFVSSVGINEEQIRKYLDSQNKRDVPQTSRLF